MDDERVGDPSTTEVQVRTHVHAPRQPVLLLPETVDWMSGARCTVTRSEYEEATSQ